VRGAALALRLVARDLRGGLRGFRLLVVCLALGVAAIAGAGSLRSAFDAGIAGDARTLLGGDIDLRQSHLPFTEPELALLRDLGRLSVGVEMRAMAMLPDNRDRLLVEVKGVDSAYPLVGAVDLDPPLPLAEVLAVRDGVGGAAADPVLLDRLGIALGDRVRLGDAWVEIRARLTREPDRVASVMVFGPRLLVAAQTVAATGLVRPGSLIRHVARVALPEGADPGAARARITERFPDAAWQVRGRAEAAPGIGGFLDTLAAFLSLVGLTALLVGGVGVANAVRAHLDTKIETIATLKCLGASSRLILATTLLLVGLLAAVGVAIGLVAGAALVPLVGLLAGDLLPVAARIGLYPGALAQAAGAGMLAALLFTLGPLGRARRVPAARLFRLDGDPAAESYRLRDDRPVLAALLIGVAALAALVIAGSGAPPLAAGFVAAAIVILGLFRLLAVGLAGLARRLVRVRRLGASLRLGLSGLHHPGSALVGMVLSLGLGMTVLVTIALVEGNLARQIGERMPARAPSAYLIDIQPGQEGPLAAVVAETDPRAVLEAAPMVRARISTVKGVPLSQAPINPDVAWAARGDRGLSVADRPPPGGRVVAGAWWPEGYRGPPLVSVDIRVARGFGLSVGDRIGFNVLGREIEAEIAVLRDIDWASLSMNFAFLLSPGALDGAPVTLIATLKAAPGGGPAAEAALERAITDRLPNVTVIRVGEALETVRAVIAQADRAVRFAGAVVLVAGVIVLAGAVVAGHAARVRQGAVLKVLGARRRQILAAWLVEGLLVGLATGLAAIGFGAAGAWAVLTLVMKAEWVFLPGAALVALGASLGVSLGAGAIGGWRALSRRPAGVLRAD